MITTQRICLLLRKQKIPGSPLWQLGSLKGAILLALLSGAMAMPLAGAEGRNVDIKEGTRVTAIHGISLPEELPVISYELDHQAVNPLTAPHGMEISVEPVPDFTPGYKALLTLRNLTDKPVNVRNVVPFGTANKTSFLTGHGDNGLSRSHLFLPGRSPVNCVLPDNQWCLGFSTFDLSPEVSVCALARRVDGAAVKARLSRFEAELDPGGSVRYELYAELFTGPWQEGLRTMFQQRKLHDAVNFDNSLFERGDLKWIRRSYVMHLMMVWDKFYQDSADGKYHLPEFLERGKRLYGGDDVVGLWPSWPTLGVDQRNQFDLFRDLPGGLPKLREHVADCHARGTKVFVAYNPWDGSTRTEGHMEGLADILKQTDADGAILDTMGDSSRALQAAADSVRPGIVMYSEGMATPKDMQGIVSGRVHNAIYYPPLLNLNKFLKPDFAIFRVAELYKEPILREYATAYFNGHGTELNIFPPGQPDWVEEQYRFLGRTSMILRENTENFTDSGYTPLIPTLRDSIYVNRWPHGEKLLYTIFSLIPEGFDGPLFEAEPVADAHFVDLWNHRELHPEEVDGKPYLRVDTAAFDKKFLGTNNEGAVGCVARLPRCLHTSLQGDVLSVEAQRGDLIKIWAGAPAYDKTPILRFPGRHEIKLLNEFGRFEGDFVIQLFENGLLLDENIQHILPGTPRLVSTTVKTRPATGQEAEMIRIPEGEFTFKTTHGDAFIPYPQYNQGKTYHLSPFMMDRSPVTNAQFLKFVTSSGYQPSDPVNFLRHWKDGKPRPGEENFPVVHVSLEDARAYAEWAGKRLPSEIEWQYAAQAGDGRDWPWAKDTPEIKREEEPVTGTLTVFRIKGISDSQANTGNGQLDPVGHYPEGANPLGLLDLVGSVWQLTSDVYQSGSYTYLMMKGGSYYNPSSSWWYVQGGPRELHYRQFLLRVSQGFERNATVGFRCVKDF